MYVVVVAVTVVVAVVVVVDEVDATSLYYVRDKFLI